MHGWISCSSTPCIEGLNVDMKDCIVECAESANLEEGRITRPVLVTVGASVIIGFSTTLFFGRILFDG